MLIVVGHFQGVLLVGRVVLVRLADLPFDGLGQGFVAGAVEIFAFVPGVGSGGDAFAQGGVDVDHLEFAVAGKLQRRLVHGLAGRGLFSVEAGREHDVQVVAFRLGRGLGDPVEDGADVGGHRVGGRAMQKVVVAGAHENLGGVLCGDLADAVEHVFGGIVGDAAVLEGRIPVELVPEAAIDIVVAHQHDVVRVNRHFFV